MSKNARKCFKHLQKLGCPVKEWHDKSRGHFWISAEEENSDEWLDYYSMTLCAGSERLNKIMNSYGLWFEWQNSAVAHVYSI
jgi:hypothetical protein